MQEHKARVETVCWIGKNCKPEVWFSLTCVLFCFDIPVQLREIVEVRGAWCAAVRGVTKRRTWLSDWTTTTTVQWLCITCTMKSKLCGVAHTYCLLCTFPCALLSYKHPVLQSHRPLRSRTHTTPPTACVLMLRWLPLPCHLLPQESSSSSPPMSLFIPNLARLSLLHKPHSSSG